MRALKTLIKMSTKPGTKKTLAIAVAVIVILAVIGGAYYYTTTTTPMQQTTTMQESMTTPVTSAAQPIKIGLITPLKRDLRP